ncbi:FGGY family carbohydrate kinase [Lignipirellula cremea]|uniref:FGGY family carbohydrate kinase n=1 Tax=Lignipirellula cremea TaxID=2528010 RepID=UPI0018D20DDB|nr:FGGY family carbohydrate kinase [Lignipirellula cremea]
MAAWLGFDISTTAVTALVRSKDGEEDFVAAPMQGRTTWFEQPAFDHNYLPLLLLHTIVSFQNRGWSFADQQGCLALSIRQHDLTLLDADGRPLGPAITWECSIAEEEAAQLNADSQVQDEVGPVAARMLTPKAQWLLERDPSLRSRIHTLCTTADWINAELTGKASFGSSDGLSNAQLKQRGKTCATYALEKAGLPPDWQPPVVHSGQVVGPVRDAAGGRPLWRPLLELLQGWRVGAPLGDNNAGALGMGVHAPGRLALSAGSSGTAVTVCPGSDLPSPTAGEAAPLQFEFYDLTMLLTMLPRCALAYDKFRADYLPAELIDSHEQLNQMALDADLGEDSLVLVESTPSGEMVPAGWSELSPGQQTASMQFSIAVGLLRQAQAILQYLPGAEESIRECVLTGGLSQSQFFQETIAVGMTVLAGSCRTLVSARTGPSRFQAASRGAMMTAMLPDREQDLSAIALEMEEVEACPQPTGERATQLTARLQQALS